MVVSTNCRSCGFHIEILDGKPLARYKESRQFKPSDKPPIQHPVVAPKEAEVKKAEKDSRGFFARVFQRSAPKKAVNCFHCGKDFDVVLDAQSTQCPKCGGYIGLEDIVVGEAWPKRIETRGTVTILKEGSVLGLGVCCHDLILMGKLSGAVQCSGSLVIRCDGRIVGDLKCAELHVDKGVKVEIQGMVEVDRAFIDGEVRAQILCKGTIRLGRKAHLQGMARAGKLELGKGARHTGAMELLG